MSDKMSVKDMTQPATPATALPELKSFLEGLAEPHILFDGNYRILAANAAYRRQFGTEASVLGRTCYAVSHHFDQPCDQSGESCPLRQARESGQPERVLHLHHTPQGEVYVNIELLPLRDARGDLRYFIEKMQALPTALRGDEPQALSGRSPEFQRMLALVARVGPTEASVLLTGETGTGKELVAQELHAASRRARAPFVAVDCASLAETLFESELFGHERGAFTGANATKPGLVEAANGGTLFLDEVGDIPAAIQVKLLRLLESGTFRRVGSTEIRHADVRLVSATHRDLPQRVAEGLFREDLYFRLAVFPVHLPALRDRTGDVPVLAHALLARLDPSGHLSLSPDALARLAAHPYPGNIRELRNVLERCTVLCDGAVIEAGHVAQALALGRPGDRRHAPTGPAAARDATAPRVRRGSPPTDLHDRLAALGGSRAALAAQLGVTERTVYRWLGRDPAKN